MAKLDNELNTEEQFIIHIFNNELQSKPDWHKQLSILELSVDAKGIKVQFI